MKAVRGVVVMASAGAGFAVGALAARRVLERQAAIARRRIGKPLGEEHIPADRVWRRKLGGEPIDLLVLGDSLAAGLGATHRKETLGARLAKGLAARVGRPVRLHVAAVVGSESNALAGQLDSVPGDFSADVAVIIAGGNDVTHVIYPTVASAHLESAIRRLRSAGVGVVVGTCPDLGALRPVPQPLRSIMSRMSHHMELVQTRVAKRAGAVPVSLRQVLRSAFRDDPEGMFSLDRFHPSPAGYRLTASALVPALERVLLTRTSAVRGGDYSMNSSSAATPRKRMPKTVFSTR